MDFDLSNLDGTQVDGASTAVFTFYDLPGEPWLRVRAGGELNRPYFAALLASQTKNRKRLMKGTINAEMLERNRQIDRKLYPQHMDAGDMGGWRNRVDGVEMPLEYSPAAWAAVVQALPNDLFDEVRSFCNEPSNFRSENEPDQDEIEETAGN